MGNNSSSSTGASTGTHVTGGGHDRPADENGNGSSWRWLRPWEAERSAAHPVSARGSHHGPPPPAPALAAARPVSRTSRAPPPRGPVANVPPVPVLPVVGGIYQGAPVHDGHAGSSSVAAPFLQRPSNQNQSHSQPRQTMRCPRCTSQLVVPPGAHEFRCPCGVHFSRQDGTHASYTVTQAPVTSAQTLQVVLCSHCGRVGMLPNYHPEGLFQCQCGTPVFPATPAQLLQFLNRPAGGHGVPVRRGAPKSLINMLPVIVFKKEESFMGYHADGDFDEDDDKVSCRVCLEEYKTLEELRILPCLHKFHKCCIDEWLTERSTFCPLCNTSVDVILQSGSSVEGDVT